LRLELPNAGQHDQNGEQNNEAAWLHYVSSPGSFDLTCGICWKTA
jgi:hypothetical protein